MVSPGGYSHSDDYELLKEGIWKAIQENDLVLIMPVLRRK